MKITMSLFATGVAAVLLLAGCRTPNQQTCGPFPTDYESIVRSYITTTFKHSDRLEWKAITFPRQGSLWRGVLFGGAKPCWQVDVTLDEKNSSGGYVAYQRTIYIKNDRVVGSRPFHPEGERFISVGREVSFEEVSKMPPFNAVVESVDIDHPFFVYTTVDIRLRRTDNGKLLDLAFSSPNTFILGFARSLHLGQEYSFPQVFGHYATSLSSNAGRPVSTKVKTR